MFFSIRAFLRDQSNSRLAREHLNYCWLHQTNYPLLQDEAEQQLEAAKREILWLCLHIKL